MKITAISPQRRKGRANLYIDDSFYSGVDVGTLASLGLYEGAEIEPQAIEKLSCEEEYQNCLHHAFQILNSRPQAKNELILKLKKKHTGIAIAKTIDRLEDLGYINDNKFAKQWVSERSKTRGKKLLYNELIAKGINKNTIDYALNELDKPDFLPLFEKKYRDNKSPEENKQKITQFLLRKGFSYNEFLTKLKTFINNKTA